MRFKQLTIMVILLLLICSCTPVKRGMLNNHTYYSSSNPNIRIDVNDEFVLRQNAHGSGRYEFVNPEAHREVLIEYEDIMVNENQVDYYENPLTWIFYAISGSEEITKGEIRILGKKWYFRDIVFHHSSASCFLIRDIGHFTDRHDILKVLYSQELPPYQCSSWKQVESLDKGQQKRLKRFLDNLDQDIRMSNYTPD